MVLGSIDIQREAHVEELERMLRNIVKLGESRDDIRKIILFGSYARGRRDLFTDLDVVLVVKNRLPYPDRWHFYRKLIEGDAPLDLFCYTEEEWEKMKKTLFGKQIIKSGKVVHEK